MTTRIGLLHEIPPRQQPFITWTAASHWRVWVIYNREVTAGTYLELYPNGNVDRVTINEAGDITSCVRIHTRTGETHAIEGRDVTEETASTRSN